MDNEVISHAEGDEKILSCNIPPGTGTTAAGHSSVQRACGPGSLTRRGFSPLLPPLGMAPAGEIAEREHQEAAQHHVIDHHQGVCGFHATCSQAASMCETPQARHSKI